MGVYILFTDLLKIKVISEQECVLVAFRTIRVRHRSHKHLQYTENLSLFICNFIFKRDLDKMTLTIKLDLDTVKMYLHTENEIPSFSGSKVIARTDRQADRPD